MCCDIGSNLLLFNTDFKHCSFSLWLVIVILVFWVLTTIGTQYTTCEHASAHVWCKGAPQYQVASQRNSWGNQYFIIWSKITWSGNEIRAANWHQVGSAKIIATISFVSCSFVLVFINHYTTIITRKVEMAGEWLLTLIIARKLIMHVHTVVVTTF